MQVEYTSRFVAAFWSKVDRSSCDGCWPWIGAMSSHRYGMITAPPPAGRRGIRLSSHRVAWELTYGPIAPGLHVCHRCDNRACCRPDHLWLGTAQDNNLDKLRKGRQAKGERSGQAKLTTANVRLIRQRYSLGEANAPRLAKEFGMSESAVRFIVAGAIWTDVVTWPVARPGTGECPYY